MPGLSLSLFVGVRWEQWPSCYSTDHYHPPAMSALHDVLELKFARDFQSNG